MRSNASLFPATWAAKAIVSWTVLVILVGSVFAPAFSADLGEVPEPPPGAKESERPWTTGVDLDFNSQYIWRGLVYSEGPVFNPSFWISIEGFTFTTWMNVDLTDEPDRKVLNEVDFYFAYEGTWKKLTFEPSIFVYYYPTQLFGPTTAEFYLKLSYPVGPIHFFTAQSMDLVQYQGAYFGEFGLTFERELFDGFILETSLSTGWASPEFNSVYIGPAKWALNVLTYGLRLTYYPLDFLYIRPHMEVTALIDGDLRAAVAQPTIIWGGMSLGFDF